jgi:hypothetical protein
MARIITILIILTLAAGSVHALGIGGEGLRFGRVGATAGKAKSAGPQPTGFVLMVDGASRILQTDGASKICRAGGC